MTKLLSNVKAQEAAKVIALEGNYATRMGYLSAVFREIIEPAIIKPTPKPRKKVAYLGYFTNNPKIDTGLRTSRCSVQSLFPCKEIKTKGFISWWGYYEPQNVLKINMDGRTYFYLHVTPSDMKKLSNYSSIGKFYHGEIKGRKNSFTA